MKHYAHTPVLELMCCELAIQTRQTADIAMCSGNPSIPKTKSTTIKKDVQRMKLMTSKKSLAIAIGTAFSASLVLTPAALADTNPFGVSELSGGYMQLAEAATPAKAAKSNKIERRSRIVRKIGDIRS